MCRDKKLSLPYGQSPTQKKRFFRSTCTPNIKCQSSGRSHWVLPQGNRKISLKHTKNSNMLNLKSTRFFENERKETKGKLLTTIWNGNVKLHILIRELQAHFVHLQPLLKTIWIIDYSHVQNLMRTDAFFKKTRPQKLLPSQFINRKYFREILHILNPDPGLGMHT